MNSISDAATVDLHHKLDDTVTDKDDFDKGNQNNFLNSGHEK